MLPTGDITHFPPLKQSERAPVTQRWFHMLWLCPKVVWRVWAPRQIPSSQLSDMDPTAAVPVRVSRRAPVSPGSPSTVPAPHLRREIRYRGPSSKHENQAATAWGSHLGGLVHATEEQLPIHSNTSQEKFYRYWQFRSRWDLLQSKLRDPSGQVRNAVRVDQLHRRICKGSGWERRVEQKWDRWLIAVLDHKLGSFFFLSLVCE